MKKIFTLFACASLIAAKSFSQITETFETSGDFTNLISQCWSFTTVSHNGSTPIDGAGSVTSQLNSTSQIATPYLNIGSSLTISFNYQRVAVSGGSRTLKIYLVDTAGTQTILDNITLNDASMHSYSNTFDNSNTPGTHFPIQGKIMFQFSDNVSVTFDDLNISANYFYPGGCAPAQSPLPVYLVSFQGNLDNSVVTLKWSVAQNETSQRFEIEKSTNGTDFSQIGVVNATGKAGDENYSFTDNVSGTSKVMYRLKMYDVNNKAEYSKVLAFQMDNTDKVRIINNPVSDKITLSYVATTDQVLYVNVYDMTGRLHLKQTITASHGVNVVNLPLSSNFKSGIYVVELNDGIKRNVWKNAKFVKQ
jgi:hypothetical protein